MSRRFHHPGAGSGTRAGPCRRNRMRSLRIRAMVQNEEKPAMNRCTHRSGHRKAAETSRRWKRKWKRINIGLTTTQDAMAEERKRFMNTRRVTRTISIGNSLVIRYSREYLPSRKTGRAIRQTKGICETNIDATLGNIYESSRIEPTVRYGHRGWIRVRIVVLLKYSRQRILSLFQNQRSFPAILIHHRCYLFSNLIFF